jgi:hypothetical protein
LLESSQATRLHAGLMTSVDELGTEEAPRVNGAAAAVVTPGVNRGTDTTARSAIDTTKGEAP